MNIVLEKSAAWHEERRSGIGASEAGKIMDGDWLALWKEKTGKEPPEDLSENLAVQMGVFTEPLNIYWFTKSSGLSVTTDKARCRHPAHPWMQCELDGRVDSDVFEAKHVSAFAKPEEIVSRYFWNCQHQMAVTGASKVYLSVFFGNSKWEFFEVPRDEQSIADLIARESEFWGYVERNEPPPSHDAVKVQISLDDMREVDLTGNNEWGAYAADWLANKAPAKKFETATKGLKDLIEADVKLAFGHGVKVSRAKSGALTVREQ